MVNDHQDQSGSVNTDQADLDALNEEKVNRIVNSAISNRMKSFERKMDEFMGKFTQPTEEKPVKEEKVSNTELLQLKRQLEAIQKERDTEVSKRKDTELRNVVKEQLLKAGVNPSMVKAAMAILVDSDKVVGYDEADQVSWKDNDLGSIDLASGLRNWSKTDEGKSFIAPKLVQGTGAKGFSNKVNKLENKLSRSEVGSMLEQALLGGDLDQ
jgi:hypothetical protein